jgi:protein-S-isoprenylcysteine O-methyltransferase Ste14
MKPKKTYAERLVRLRVPLTWALGLTAIALARPTPRLLVMGFLVAALGEALRIWSAGHLIKGGEVTQSGPYAWTRNPLYLGSSLMGLGFSVAAGRWELLVFLIAFLFAVYRPVIKTEARKLAERFPEAYERYAKAVPLFLPRPWRKGTGKGGRRFSWMRVRANREVKTIGGWLAVAILLWVKMKWAI